MEKIGHFLDDAVAKIYKKLKEEGFTKAWKRIEGMTFFFNFEKQK